MKAMSYGKGFLLLPQIYPLPDRLRHLISVPQISAGSTAADLVAAAESPLEDSPSPRSQLTLPQGDRLRGGQE